MEPILPLPPLARFAVVMAAILVVPLLCRRIRLPGVVGLMCVGMVVGPYGFGLAPKNAEALKLLSEIGKLMLMFMAGMELDLKQFQRTARKSLVFGFLTFALPMLAGMAVGITLGYTWLTAILLGSLLASHTLLGFPIVEKFGVVKNEAVTVTIGATILTDLLALLVLAICLPVHQHGFEVGPFLIQIGQLVVFVPFVLFGLGGLGRVILSRMNASKESQFALIFLIIIVSSLGAKMINLEGIIGAFLAGIAVNEAIKNLEAKHEIEFMANNLFIPAFFIIIGFMINLKVFIPTLIDHAPLVIGIVGGLLLAKYLAALFTQRIFGYSRNETVVMWSLSMPQVAATLAAAIVAFECLNSKGERLIDQPILNTVIVLMVVTSILGPILTESYAKKLQGI